MKITGRETRILSETTKGRQLEANWNGTHPLIKSCVFISKEERDLADEIAKHCDDQNDWRWKFIATARILGVESSWAL